MTTSPESLDDATVAKPPTSTIPDTKAPDHRRYNPLSEYSSQTHQLVLAMVTPDAYVDFVKSGRKNFNLGQADAKDKGIFIIARSGGINNNTYTRAAGFDLDYYIDNLKISCAADTSSTGGPVANYEMSFNIIEPYGFSFISRLKKALDYMKEVSTLPGQERQNDPSTCIYILGIQFLGYDKNGEVMPTSKSTMDRYYDIKIQEMVYDLDGRMVTYKIKAATIPTRVGTGTKQGIITRDMSVTGRTVGSILEQFMDKLSADQIPVKPDPKAKVLPSALQTSYAIEFRGPGSDLIKNAVIVSKADTDKLKWPMGITAAEGPDSAQRTVSFRNGTPIIQAMGQLIQQSSYLEEALKMNVPSDTVPVDQNGNPEEIVPDTKKSVRWFNVSMEVIPKAWNGALKDYTYEVKYIIQPYLTPMTISSNVNKTTPYYGPVKRYDYWYTGKNTEVLRLSFNINNNYFSTVFRQDNVTAPESGSTSTPIVAGQRTGQSTTGKLNSGTEGSSNYTNSLYDPGSWVQLKMDIMGDPDWLTMDSTPPIALEEYNSFYGPDGYSINPKGGQLFIEINFYEPIDYENKTGTLKINDKLMLWEYPPGVLEANNAKGICYKVTDIVSTFSGGQFKQTLTGVINPFDNTVTAAKPTERPAAPTPAALAPATPQGTAAASIRKVENDIAKQNADDDAGAGAQAARQTVTDRMANSRFGRLSRNNAASNIDRNF